MPTTSPTHASYLLNKFMTFYSILISTDNTAAHHCHIFITDYTRSSPRDRAMRRVSYNFANCHAAVQKLLVRQVLNQVSAVATKSCCRQRLAICAINYSGRTSELGGIIDLVDRRRPSLSRCERLPFSS